MRKKKGSGREITFFSKKCGCVISVFGSETRALAEKLENDGGVLRYESGIPLLILLYRKGNESDKCQGQITSYGKQERLLCVLCKKRSWIS